MVAKEKYMKEKVKFLKHRCCPNSPSLRDHLYASCEQEFGVVIQILMDYCSLFPLLSDGVGINDDNNQAHDDPNLLEGGSDYDYDDHNGLFGVAITNSQRLKF